LFSLKKLEVDLRPEALAFGTWLAEELCQYDSSREVNMEQLLGKIVLKAREQRLEEAELAAAMDVCVNLTEFYGCCVMANLTWFIINERKEENRSLARYLIAAATHFLDMKARKGQLTDMNIELAKFVLSKADQVGLSPLSAVSSELKKAVGYGG